MRCVPAALSIGVFTALAGCAALQSPEAPRFASCDAARNAVQAAGPDGLQFAHERVYSDDACFRPRLPEQTAFRAVRRIEGEQCTIGYVCIEMSSDEGEG